MSNSDELSPADKPRWLHFAEQELGITTYPDGDSNPRVMQYHCGTNIHGYDDKAAWCSSFVNWVFTQAEIKGTNSALARSWLDWGRPLEEPQYGCVTILEREDPNGWQGHVGLFIEQAESELCLLGGNQLGKVCYHHYPISSLLGYRISFNIRKCVHMIRIIQ